MKGSHLWSDRGLFMDLPAIQPDDIWGAFGPITWEIGQSANDLWSKFSRIEWKTLQALIHDYCSRSPANTRFVVFSTYHNLSPRVQPEIVRLLQLQCMMSGYWTAVVMDFPKVSKRQRGPKRGITHRIHQMGIFICLHLVDFLW